MTEAGWIDAHVHLWNAERGDDILIVKERPEIANSANAPCLARHLEESCVGGAIVIQAAPDRGHSDWLRRAARQLPQVVGVVGWIDLNGDNARADAEVLIADDLVCGVRLMLNRMSDAEQIATAGAISVMQRMASNGLAIEYLAPNAKLPIIVEMAQRLPGAVMVVDHCGLPPPARSDRGTWLNSMRALAGQPNVYVKLSGLVENFGPRFVPADVCELGLQMLDIFGPRRLMAASNFPVAELAGGTASWLALLDEIVHRAGLGSNDRDWLFRKTAEGFWFRRRPRSSWGPFRTQCRTSDPDDPDHPPGNRV